MTGKTLLFMKYHRLHHLFFQFITRSMGNPLVHPGQARLLGCLLEKGSISQGELNRHMQVSAAAVAVSLKRLEQQGLITRQQNPGDRREKLLSLTPFGVRMAQDIRLAVDRMEELAIRGFTEEELHSMAGYLDRMMDNLMKDFQFDTAEMPKRRQGE